MTHRRTSARRITVAATGVAALFVGSFAVAQASASPADEAATPSVLTSAEAGTLATTLVEELGDTAAAGTYYESDSQTLVVNVLDESAAALVEESGAEARIVENSQETLNEVMTEVDTFAVPGTSWSVDPVSNAVKVKVDSTVSEADLADIQAGVSELGDLATLESVNGEFQPFVAGGDAIYSSGARCSAGFNVNGGAAFLTAGHCGSVGSSWSDTSGGSPIGTMTAGEFPGADYALVEYSSGSGASEVNRYDGSTQSISGAAEAVVGQSVERSGSTTGLHGGSVTGTDVAVSYPQGTVYGTIETDVCAEPGDSGGALFSGSDAVGLTSGGSGNCSSGGQTFFYPVTDALAATGSQLP
ncbi:streptogrisin D [Streptomyces zhaozhouensis]|uniref:Streptogrisin D n=1 Tax=Streptomyces zhaozhouensis TaxID=1300267 RepID=A0A286DSZ3_9ACTN|nr:S1 family peptidase [Streptomyces zhaozhouensis]SOD61796.1 streptogrisin D [Streptomyces zhaozhouensis]